MHLNSNSIKNLYSPHSSSDKINTKLYNKNNRLFMKLFKTKSIDVVKACQSFTGSEVPSCVLKRKTDKFILFLRFNCVKILFAIFVAHCNVSVEYFFFLVKLV